MQTQATVFSSAVHTPAKTIPGYDRNSPSLDSGLALDEAMLRAGAISSFTRGQEIFADDEPADHIYKVLSGAVCAYKILSDGRRQINAFYLADECFGLEFVDRRSLAAEAISDTRILVVKRTSLMALAGHDAAVARQLFVLAAGELARAQDRVLRLAKTSEERVAGFLLEMAKRSTGNSIDLPMLRQDIADYLGLTIETVSRTLKTLTEYAAIEVSTRHVVLRNRSTLNRING
jgi:CRP/FNR family transcriptional regulator, nitrogen fixation regulation protein